MYRVTGSSFPPHKDLVRHIVYGDTAAEGRANSAWLGDNNPDRAGKSAKEVLSDYIEALLIHISTKAASQRGGPPLGKSDTELVMLVPTAWPRNLKRTILHVSCSLIVFRSSYSPVHCHALNIKFSGCTGRQCSRGCLGHIN